MGRYGLESCPPECRAQVDGLVEDIRAALGDNLVGVYLHGSLAMGCFNPQTSDLDVLVVTRERMASSQRRAVAARLVERDETPRPLELSVLSMADLHPWRHPAPYALHYGSGIRDRYRRELEGSEDSGLLS